MKTTINISKIGQTREVDFDKLPEASQNFIIGYGLQQVLNDCHASIQRKDYDSEEEFGKAVSDRVETKLDALHAGKITIRAAGTREPVDPVAKLVYRMAKDAVESAIKAKGVKLREVPKEKLGELIAAYSEKHGDQLTKEAKAQIKKAESIAADIDLGDLGL